MPNWCSNDLILRHEDTTKVDALVRHIVNALDADEGARLFQYLHPRPDAEADNWYDWNISNWGTKWDAMDITLAWHGNNDLCLQFLTAWSPPLALYHHLEQEGWVIEQALYKDEFLNFFGYYGTGGRDACYEDHNNLDPNMPEALREFLQPDIELEIEMARHHEEMDALDREDERNAFVPIPEFINIPHIGNELEVPDDDGTSENLD